MYVSLSLTNLLSSMVSLTEAFNIESLSYVRSMAALSPEKYFELKTPKKNRSQAFKRFVLTTLMFTEQQDIQIRGANRDEKKIMMALRYPNSTHYLTYRHSLRSYVAILYLRLPPGFKIILRGREVQHHSLVDDLMYPQELTYRPQGGVAHVSKESDMMAVVTIGFVKDAKDHVNLQGFNVYHKNRLIKVLTSDGTLLPV
jgi:hypothetical protein